MGKRYRLFRIKQSTEPGKARLSFLLVLLFGPQAGGVCSSETSVTFNGLCGYIYQKTEPFNILVTTAQTFLE
jgi:hypothetical protein